MGKEHDREGVEQELKDNYDAIVSEWFDEREFRLIRNAMIYAQNDPAGLPGHKLMLVVDKLCAFLGFRFPQWMEERWIGDEKAFTEKENG